MNRTINEAERRTRIVAVVLRADERAKVEAAAAAEGLTLSGFVRRAVLQDLRRRARQLSTQR